MEHRQLVSEVVRHFGAQRRNVQLVPVPALMGWFRALGVSGLLLAGGIAEAKPLSEKAFALTDFRLESVGTASADHARSDHPQVSAERDTLFSLPKPEFGLVPVARPETASLYGPPDDQASSAGASAEERHLAKIERLNGKLEVAFQIVNALDAIETISCSHKIGCREGNPLFGDKPSTARVLAIKGAVAGLHYYVYKKRNRIEPKGVRFFEIVTTVVYTAVAGININRVF